MIGLQQADINSLNALFAGIGGVSVFVLIIVWSGIWKAIALWKAARRGDTAWYVIITLLNTVGILEIIYIFAVAKEKK